MALMGLAKFPDVFKVCNTDNLSFVHLNTWLYLPGGHRWGSSDKLAGIRHRLYRAVPWSATGGPEGVSSPVGVAQT